MFPKQIKYIIGNEAAERYSFYGMKSILVVFMTTSLLMDKNQAVSNYHIFSAACYLTPLFGAWLADRYLGKYKTIMTLSLFYCVGHGILSIWENALGLTIGLGFIALGAGGIKPCVSAHVGDQFQAGQEALLRKVFDLFYWMINFGSFFSTLLTPWTYQKYGAGVAFGIPGILMALATLIFWMGRKYYVHVPPSGPNPHSFWIILKNILIHGKEKALQIHGQQKMEGVKAVFGVMSIFVWITLFWSLFEQHGSTWTLQAQQMDRQIAGFQLHEAQIQALNPIIVLLFIPLFSLVIYPTIEKLGIRLTPLRKMSSGMILAGSAFAFAAFIQQKLELGQNVSVLWQVVSYGLITSSEILVSITGLEFAYTQAPREMKSTVMSLFFITVFLGNTLTAIMSKLNTFPVASSSYFLFFAGLMLLAGILFSINAHFYKMRNYMEQKA